LRSSLAQGRGQFVAIANAMPHLIWLADSDGTVNFYNERWVRYTGITVDDVQPEAIRDVVHPDDRDVSHERWNAALRSNTPYEVEYRLRNVEDGSYRWFLARAVTILDESGQNPLWVGTATDIDDQKRTRASLEFLLGAVNAFATSQGVAEVCNRFAQLAVGQFADSCLVSLFEAPDTFVTVAEAHRNPSRADGTDRNSRRQRTSRISEAGVAQLSTQSVLRPALIKVRRAEPGERHLRLAQNMNMTSVMIVPLRSSSEEFYGTIMFGLTGSRRAFNAADLTVAERAAVRAAEAIRREKQIDEERRSAQRLRLLAKANEELLESLDVTESFQRLAELMVGEIADFVFVNTIEGNELRTVAAAHRDPALEPSVKRLRGVRTLRPHAEQSMIEKLRDHRPVLTHGAGFEKLSSTLWPYLANEISALRPHSALIVPIFARGGATHGGLFAYYSDSEREYDQNDVPTMIEIARRISIAIENTQSHERERRIAATLQQASLPSALPVTADLRFEGVYTPTTQGGSLGGDWYDAIAFDDGSVMVSVGDVAGSGLEAAVIMSKARHIIGVGPLHQTDPGKILDAADWILAHRYPGAIVTAFVGLISADRTTIRFANAGHPYPIVRRGSELIELRSSGLPLGIRKLAPPSPTETATLKPDDLLVLFTDGLTEWGRDWAEGERRLRSVISSSAVAHTARPAQFIHDACLTGGSRDDVALMTVALGAHESWSFEAENANAASDARTEFIAYLRSHIEDEGAIDRAELIFGELMANVVRHAPGHVSVNVDWCGSDPVIHVIDHGPPFQPKPELPDELSETGRGMYLILSASVDLKVERIEEFGNHISVRLRGGRLSGSAPTANSPL
jgi:sigma-B regulation protein RsbU (phosphoserine phosphatase)